MGSSFRWETKFPLSKKQWATCQRSLCFYYLILIYSCQEKIIYPYVVQIASVQFLKIQICPFIPKTTSPCCAGYSSETPPSKLYICRELEGGEFVVTCNLDYVIVF